MKLNIRDATYHYEFLRPFDQNKATLICLHGFTGTGATFHESLKQVTQYNVLVVDLLGHGQSTVVIEAFRYQMVELCQDLASLINFLVPGKKHLLGYSMGARVALALAIIYPELMDTLILESGSPGLAKPEERLLRRQSDEQLAIYIQSHPLTDFVDKWENIPLFASQKALTPDVQARLRAERLKQNKEGLAQSLKQMGTGSQPNYWQSLVEIRCPILYIAGELDSKFCAISNRMKASHPCLKQEVISNVGHCVHLEAPNKFREVIIKWLE
ncbi:2-succinyl-6-hydroxy-2,4-cyclohexadiene-1-carboxylate synthase [Vagococcus intermedius]|uniref:Putative 2-succinyl-6-hydroxy-2,4-cyclohexadiene-1-carboxylate synthase n=1 Tax=Vagococcus intermedius TaxID=2991418 RepID=A0AAF0I595_9ENTE|nr:2-succinyl-6-hydroxy-2,4-cyclohexadiene-1-carboxylate synthase [Vagococcus intermedius]WEG72838.1 2-succinyl-6-hydroxy-2,4-cyclohexadiene-1-carboxylate synthase [Vagococcus intermedius]WEG74924.1 2-succinyl-6-hydroxy-2,4-cyclohexadiene-1-carboxylate synthase [Vagococcus intermedius]